MPEPFLLAYMEAVSAAVAAGELKPRVGWFLVIVAKTGKALTGKECGIYQRDIAARLNVTERQVRRYASQAIELGWLIQTRQGGGAEGDFAVYDCQIPTAAKQSRVGVVADMSTREDVRQSGEDCRTEPEPTAGHNRGLLPDTSTRGDVLVTRSPYPDHQSPSTHGAESPVGAECTVKQNPVGTETAQPQTARAPDREPPLKIRNGQPMPEDFRTITRGIAAGTICPECLTTYIEDGSCNCEPHNEDQERRTT